jgi:hypothetical protein
VIARIKIPIITLISNDQKVYKQVLTFNLEELGKGMQIPAIDEEIKIHHFIYEIIIYFLGIAIVC